MNKKDFDLNVIENELKGASLFFPTAESRTEPKDGHGTKVEDPKQDPYSSHKLSAKDQRVPPKAAVGGKVVDGVVSQQASETETTGGAGQPPHISPDPSSQASKKDVKQASELASYHASNQAAMIEGIRRVVKAVGAKTTFVRLTEEEKARLVEVAYTYKRQGIKTSENELVRIAIGYLLEEYSESGNDSMLAKVLAALNA